MNFLSPVLTKCHVIWPVWYSVSLETVILVEIKAELKLPWRLSSLTKSLERLSLFFPHLFPKVLFISFHQVAQVKGIGCHHDRLDRHQQYDCGVLVDHCAQSIVFSAATTSRLQGISRFSSEEQLITASASFLFFLSIPPLS